MKNVMWMLGGAAVGAGTALLFAPTTGKRVRALIRDKVTHYTHEMADTCGSKARHWQNKMTGWSHKATRAAHEASDFMHDATGTPHEETVGTAAG